MKKIFCIGEFLIDFICTDVSVKLIEGKNFSKKAGGAPANVAACISKLGGEVYFAGRVGKDPFGEFLINELKKSGVKTDYTVFDEKSFTTMAYVSIAQDGERDFIFSRGADEHLCSDDIPEKIIDKCEIFHFGSATALLGGQLEEVYFEIMRKARANNKFISFDPNYRVDLWRGKEDVFIRKTREALKYSSFVKMSDEEIILVTGNMNIEQAVNEIHMYGVKIVAVTLGKKGTLVSNGGESKIIGSIEIESIDSTGAGDAFVGGVLHNFANFENIKETMGNFDRICEIIKKANIVGALTCTKYGAIDALPTKKDIEKYF